MAFSRLEREREREREREYDVSLYHFAEIFFLGQRDRERERETIEENFSFANFYEMIRKLFISVN